MFVNAFETVTKFTRPIHSIRRYYGSTDIFTGAATLFFINSDGWALTCRHVAQLLGNSKQASDKYKKFKEEFMSRKDEKKAKNVRKELERKYGYSRKDIIELYNCFLNCIEGDLKYQARMHQKLDIALLKFETDHLLCNTFPIFPNDSSGLKQGKYLCRLGFPFPEFTNYKYDETKDSIVWTVEGRHDSPYFPIEGMVTRHVADDDRKIVGFEMSTPGLRGQSGGPVFDIDGKVWGMQSMTVHLDLDFDVDQEVLRDGSKKRVQDSAFLHVGRCIHVDALKTFMRENNVQFQEK